MKKWWKDTVFYQIYLPSLLGIPNINMNPGEKGFPGILSMLPYLKELGVGGIWLTPFYPSPKVDNGYDVSDYCGIDPLYGTMEDFQCMVNKAHALGIRVITDIVINHTSTQHPWFVEAASSLESPKRDWYIWKKPKNGEAPNNWESFFGGSAWELDPVSGEYYYHSFAREQADLNWTNLEIREAVTKVLDFWIQKGVDGFRFDVINNLTVSEDLTNNPAAEDKTQIHENDVNQNGIHETIAFLCKEVRSRKPDAFLVGEISSDRLLMIHSYVGKNEMDVTFNFNLGSRERFCFSEVFHELEQMRSLYDTEKLPTLFFGSHDMGRFPSRFSFTPEQVKCLLTLIFTYRGVPFLYSGDELGMKNKELNSVEEARDVQGILAYERAAAEGKSREEAIRILNEKSRDLSRTPLDWEAAGKQKNNRDSTFHFTKSLIEARGELKELRGGTVKISEPGTEVLLIERQYEERLSWAVINFSDKEFHLKLPEPMEMILASVPGAEKTRESEAVIPPAGSAVLKKL